MYFHEATELTINGLNSVEPAGTLVIFSPKSLSGYQAKDAKLHHSWLRASGSLPESLANAYHLPIDHPIHVGEQMDPTPWLNLMMRELDLYTEGPNLALSSLLRGWLSQVSRGVSMGHAAPERLLTARSSFEAHCLSTRNLADYAAQAGMSESRFCDAFSKAFSISPIHYRNFCRLEHARELLESTQLRVSEIAERCGFGDAFHFSKSFKKHSGSSPRDYRSG